MIEVSPGCLPEVPREEVRVGCGPERTAGQPLGSSGSSSSCWSAAGARVGHLSDVKDIKQGPPGREPWLASAPPPEGGAVNDGRGAVRKADGAANGCGPGTDRSALGGHGVGGLRLGCACHGWHSSWDAIQGPRGGGFFGGGIPRRGVEGSVSGLQAAKSTRTRGQVRMYCR